MCLQSMLPFSELHKCSGPTQAVGGSTIRPTVNMVGDFYPNNLQSNKLGRTPTVLPGLKGQIDK